MQLGQQRGPLRSASPQTRGHELQGRSRQDSKAGAKDEEPHQQQERLCPASILLALVDSALGGAQTHGLGRREFKLPALFWLAMAAGPAQLTHHPPHQRNLRFLGFGPQEQLTEFAHAGGSGMGIQKSDLQQQGLSIFERGLQISLSW